jgi:hyperosmotically inducible periplasmic protein
MHTRRRFNAILLAFILAAPMLTGCGKTVNQTIDDADITIRVKTAFINDPVVGAARIDVDTFNRVVTLSGRVKSKEEEAKAIELAKSIQGVVQVKSTLQIQP